jgi:cell division protein FtsN
MTMAFRYALSAMRALRESVGTPAALAAGAVTVALLSVTPTAAQDADAAAEALRKGDLAEAKAHLGQTVKHNPADYNAAFSYASTLPPKEALKLADSINRAQTAPGWAKARGLRFSGDHFFLKEDYKKAAAAYLQASLLDSGTSAYQHLYALSIAMDGQTETARVIWNGIALDKNNELRGEAARLLALLPKPPAAPAVKDTETVKLPVVATAGQQADTPKQPAAAPAVKDTGTVKLPVVAAVNPSAAPVNQQNNTVKVDSVKTQPKPVSPPKDTGTVKLPVVTAVNPPVNQQNNAVKVDSVKTQPKPVSPPAASANQQNNAVKADSVKTPAAPADPPANPKPAGPAFTIQVGAFASKDNVDNLVKRLAGKYEDITVSTTGSGDQTLYRVRVGTFQKKEDATAFADKLIIEAGLSARVTEK